MEESDFLATFAGGSSDDDLLNLNETLVKKMPAGYVEKFLNSEDIR
jgi:hypothetical protein